MERSTAPASKPALVQAGFDVLVDRPLAGLRDDLAYDPQQRGLFGADRG
jgi:hypothetical protein